MTAEGELKIHKLESVFFDDRIDTVVIHSMYNPESDDQLSIESCKYILDKSEVSCHYVINPQGEIYQLVPEEKRAWHAGKSRMPDPKDGRTSVNYFSIGIELIGTKESGFTDAQYDSLVRLSAEIAKRYKLHNILGHSDIGSAEVRPNDPKTDPWNFDWQRYKTELARFIDTTEIKFPA